jgi:hypothetical protein
MSGDTTPVSLTESTRGTPELVTGFGAVAARPSEPSASSSASASAGLTRSPARPRAASAAPAPRARPPGT